MKPTYLLPGLGILILSVFQGSAWAEALGGGCCAVEPVMLAPPPTLATREQELQAATKAANEKNSAGPQPLGTYTVKKGASLKTVAKRTHTSLADLIVLNPGTPPEQPQPPGTKFHLPVPGSW